MEHYQHAFEQALDENEKSEQKWLNWQAELNQTRKNLSEFVKSYSVDVMVPMGKKAFVRGQLVHTNEITVCHGTTGIFSDVSSNQAIDLIGHRLKVCDENLEGLRKERELYRTKIDLPENTFGKEAGEEIVEEFDEAKENEWRLRHAENVRIQKKAEADEREKAAKEDADVLKLLDQYEMMEELADELSEMEIRDDETLDKLMRGEITVPASKMRIAHDKIDADTSINTQINRPNISPPANVQHTNESQATDSNNNDLIAKNNQEIVHLLKAYRGKIKDVLKNVKRNDEGSLNLYLELIELKEDIDDDIRKMIDEEDNSDDDDEEAEEAVSDSDDLTVSAASIDDQPRKRKVRFSTSLEDVKLIEPAGSCSDSNSDTSENNTIDITFQHSSETFNGFSDPDIVAHPGDIKSKFPQSPQLAVATKSILKTKTSTPQAEPIEDVDEMPSAVKKVFQSDIPVIGDVVEHVKPTNGHHDADGGGEETIIVAAKDDVPKKISKFRQMRRLKS